MKSTFRTRIFIISILCVLLVGGCLLLSACDGDQPPADTDNTTTSPDSNAPTDDDHTAPPTVPSDTDGVTDDPTQDIPTQDTPTEDTPTDDTTAEDGDIIVALVEDDATVKTFYRDGNRFRLQPENSSMEPIYCDELLVLGKVVASMRFYK